VPADRAARIVALVALADEDPTAAELAGFLDDPDPDVRRNAVGLLTESAPADAGVALARRLLDEDAGVRQRATGGLRELREVLVVDDALATALAAAAAVADPGIRADVARLRRELRLLDAAAVGALAADPESDVRREAAGALVAADDVAGLATLAGDGSPLVRLDVARGLGTLAEPSGAAALVALAADPDVRVRSAAVEALGAVGLRAVAPEADVGARVRAALDDGAWEVRKAAALALATGDDGAADDLLRALGDAHADVRRAAVQGLARWAGREDVRAALAGAADDPDADVRGYARLAVR
jgi:HEAT repeat protein